MVLLLENILFKKVRREVGLSPNAWVVQGGAMHWQKMGWRRGGSTQSA